MSRPTRLFDSFGRLLESKTYGIAKWFFTSRPEYDIRVKRRKYDVTEIEAPRDRLMDDVRQYVTHQFTSKLDLNCKDCIEHWTSKSEGNFGTPVRTATRLLLTSVGCRWRKLGARSAALRLVGIIMWQFKGVRHAVEIEEIARGI